MKKIFLKAQWKFWEYTLVVTGWIFGYGLPVYYSVKDKRNSAYTVYILSR